MLALDTNTPKKLGGLPAEAGRTRVQGRLACQFETKAASVIALYTVA